MPALFVTLGGVLLAIAMVAGPLSFLFVLSAGVSLAIAVVLDARRVTATVRSPVVEHQLALFADREPVLARLLFRMTIFRPTQTLPAFQLRLCGTERIGEYSEKLPKVAWRPAEGFAGTCWKGPFAGTIQEDWELPEDREQWLHVARAAGKHVRHRGNALICVPILFRGIIVGVVSVDLFGEVPTDGRTRSAIRRAIVAVARDIAPLVAERNPREFFRHGGGS